MRNIRITPNQLPVHPDTGRLFNLPKSGLPNILWIAGGSCGGKTVSSRNIADKNDIPLYNCDNKRQNHYEKADPVLHPALSRKILWPDFFASNARELFSFWEALCFERMEMILEDLSQLETDKPVLAEGVYPTPEILKAVTPEAPAVFLFADDKFLRSCYYGRESTLWMEGPFSSCHNPEKVKQKWMEKWLILDSNRKERAYSLGFKCLEANMETDWEKYERDIEKLLGIN